MVSKKNEHLNRTFEEEEVEDRKEFKFDEKLLVATYIFPNMFDRNNFLFSTEENQNVWI